MPCRKTAIEKLLILIQSEIWSPPLIKSSSAMQRAQLYMQIPIVPWCFESPSAHIVETRHLRRSKLNELPVTCSRNENIKCDSCTSWKAKSISHQLHNARGGRVKARAQQPVWFTESDKQKIANWRLYVLVAFSLSLRHQSVGCWHIFALALSLRPMRLRFWLSRSLRLQRVCVSGAIKLAHIWRDAGSKIVSPGHLTLSQLERRQTLYLTCAEIARGERSLKSIQVLISNIYTLLSCALSSLAICVNGYMVWGFLVISRAARRKIHTHLCM